MRISTLPTRLSSLASGVSVDILMVLFNFVGHDNDVIEFVRCSRQRMMDVFIKDTMCHRQILLARCQRTQMLRRDMGLAKYGLSGRCLGADLDALFLA